MTRKKNAKLKRNKVERRRILAHNASFKLKEAYKATRTNIQSLAEVNNYQSILITSFNVAEGKTTFSINLALSLAFAGEKVILLDCDMRKGRIHKYLKQPNSVGLTDVLMNNASLNDVIIKMESNGLDMIPMGSPNATPVELVGSQAMKKIIDELKKEYRYIIIDTPPSGFLTDASVLSKYVDGVILVAKYGSVKRQHVADTVGTLKKVGANILGVIFNAVKEESTPYYSYNDYYKYYYDKNVEERYELVMKNERLEEFE